VNLVPIAARVGAPRIVPTRGIPFPAGDPTLDPAAERAWRRRLLETALVAVSTEVHKPTVFDPALVPTGQAPTA
jgi:glycine reductase